MKPLSIFCGILQRSYMNEPEKARSDASRFESSLTIQPVLTLNAVALWRIMRCYRPLSIKPKFSAFLAI